MNKKRYSGTAAPVALREWTNFATSLNLTLSQFIESTTSLYVLNNKLSISQNDIESYWNGMPRNSRTNLTGDFIDKLKLLNTIASLESLKFFHNANLAGLSFSTSKQANVYKNDTFKMYFAVLTFRGYEIDSFITNNNYNVDCLGDSSKPNNEYIYISKRQNFNNPANENPNFNEICLLLGVNQDADIVKIHYEKLHKLTAVLSEI